MLGIGNGHSALRKILQPVKIMESKKVQVVVVDAAECEASQFDYEAYEPSVGKFLKSQAERIRRYVRTSAIQIGKDLIAGKRYLSHGEFHHWVLREVEIPVRTAQAYMQVAMWASGKTATITNLPPSLLYALSARSTPKEFSRILLERIEAGEPVSPSFVREQLSALRKIKKINSADTNTGTCEDDEQPNAGNDCGYVIQEAVTIISRGLESVDFERVKSILTHELVLRDPMMNQKIAMAFGTLGKSGMSIAPLHDAAQSLSPPLRILKLLAAS